MVGSIATGQAISPPRNNSHLCRGTRAASVASMTIWKLSVASLLVLSASACQRSERGVDKTTTAFATTTAAATATAGAQVTPENGPGPGPGQGANGPGAGQVPGVGPTSTPAPPVAPGNTNAGTMGTLGTWDASTIQGYGTTGSVTGLRDAGAKR